MLLPIGSDQTTVRRMPWVSFGIIALCLLVFVATLIAPGDPEAMLEAEVQREGGEDGTSRADAPVPGHVSSAHRNARAERPGRLGVYHSCNDGHR